MMGAGRDVWVKIRPSEAERTEWHAKARSAGLTPSDLVRRSVGHLGETGCQVNTVLVQNTALGHTHADIARMFMVCSL